jgi:SAM-dependent methyltransferase
MGAGMRQLYEAPDIGIVSFDIYLSDLTQIAADAHGIPLRDGAVDGVVVQAVLEHVLEPETVVQEIRRVLKPGGVVYAETPFMQQVHEGAHDFTRYSESGHRYLFRHFRELKSGSVSGPGSVLLWSMDYLSRGLFRSNLAGRLVRVGFFWLRWLDRLVPESYAIDGASGVYFMGQLSSGPITPRSAIERYRGAQSKSRPTEPPPIPVPAIAEPKSNP